jgi:2-methylcitrate dehydratase PrpD
MMDETKEISQRCHDLTYRDLSSDLIDRVKYLFLDYIGVAARGALSDSSVPIHKIISKVDNTRAGTVVIGTTMQAGPPYAALANGTAAHSLELDDVVNEASLHPAVAVMPAAMAAAQMKGSSGRDFIAAVVAGYEATIKLGIALGPAAHYARGFHPTGTCGTLGAAVTAAKLFSLDRKSMTNALGISGSQASGLMEFLNDGTFTKRLHPGWAAHSGLMAALLAAENFSGPGTVVEGKFGFLHAYSTQADAGKILKKWGPPYEIMRTSIKPHSCCRYKQGPIDGILKIMRKHRLDATEIEKVTLGILKAGFALVAEPADKKRKPGSIVDAQFSMPFGAAVAILYGKADLDEYTLENIEKPEIKSLMDKVVCVNHPELEKDYPQKWPALATISTCSGQVYATKIDYPKGDPENPLTWQELIRKFKNLVSPVYSEERQKKIIERIRAFEEEEDLNSFAALLLKE